MKQYYGNHIGIVIQNNDPDKAGKIKIFIPHISSTIYNSWVNTNSNKTIKFIGNNIDEDLTEILDDLKRITPWADCAAPLAGENSSGRFNNYNLTGSVSDSNFLETVTSAASALSGSGHAPSNFYDETTRIEDAFTRASDNINRPNPLAYSYKPNAYSNEAKGSFCIPAVGAHVWVFFREGNPNFPVYFAASFGQSDWQGIYESATEPGIDYPGTYENKNASIAENDSNVQAYRNKYVINQKGGSLEFTNSDLNEKVKLTHYSGSYKEMNNQSSIELASKNKQNLTLNDSYDTVRGFKNEYTGKNLDEIVYRDKYKKVGSLNAEYFDKWKDIITGIQEFKQLFEVKRAVDNSVKNSEGITVLKRNSLLQEREGTFAPYPVTDGSTSYKALANSITEPGTSYSNISNMSADGPAGMNEAKAPVSNISNAPSTSRWLQESGLSFTNGNGKSLSTQDGNWVVDKRKDTLKELIEASLPELTEIENELGVGGSEIIQITKHKIETIGMLMNDFGSIRMDNIGKLLSNEVLIDDKGVYVNKVDSPLLEYTHVQDLPGGNYTLNVCNRYNVMVGAGGLNLKSYGAVNLSGTITNVVGEQVNIASENEVNIDAKTVNISADILRLRNKRQRQVLIDDNLGVNKNVIIGGGMHVEGEMYVQHITAPREFQLTEKTTVFGKILGGFNIGTVGAGGDDLGNGASVSSNLTEMVIELYPHSHAFANLPLTLKDTNEEVRQSAKVLNDGASRGTASPQHNTYKG
jgi:hypothetical protein